MEVAEGYSAIWDAFWTGATGRKIVKHGRDSTSLAFYLLTSPMRNMIGLYYLPMEIIKQHTMIPAKKLEPCLAIMRNTEFALYDREQECVWVKEMARFQFRLMRNRNLDPTDNRVKAAHRQFAEVAHYRLATKFVERYRDQLCFDKTFIEKVFTGALDDTLQRGSVTPSQSEQFSSDQNSSDICQIRQAESWPPEHKPIFDWLLSQKYLPTPLEEFGLLDFDWWKLTGKTCGGLSVEILEREMPRLALWMKNNRKRWTPLGSRKRIATWLQNSVEWNQNRR